MEDESILSFIVLFSLPLVGRVREGGIDHHPSSLLPIEGRKIGLYLFITMTVADIKNRLSFIGYDALALVFISLPLVGSNKDDDTLSVSSPSRGRKI